MSCQRIINTIASKYLGFFLNLFLFVFFSYSSFPSPPSQSEEGKKIIFCFTHHSQVAVTSNRVILNSLFRRSLYNHLTRFGITGNNKKFVHSYDRLFPLLLPDENTCVLAKNASTIVSENLLICILY